MWEFELCDSFCFTDNIIHLKDQSSFLLCKDPNELWPSHEPQISLSIIQHSSAEGGKDTR